MDFETRTFGVEIEAFAPSNMTRAQLARAIVAGGVSAYDASYSHAVTPGQWKIVSDGSLLGGNGMEIVSPPLTGEAGFEQVTKVCAVLAAQGLHVNRRCGLHVHVDARRVGIGAVRNLIAFYARNERVLDSLMPPSRRDSNNNYLMSLRGIDMNRLQGAQDVMAVYNFLSDAVHYKYVKVNVQAFARQGTVEFRHHSGTIDATKINMWVKACLRMVAWAYAKQNEPVGIASSNYTGNRPAYRPIPSVYAPTTGQPVSARPRNRRLARIYDMMQQTASGVTRDQVRFMLGRNTMPPMNRILRNAGIDYTVHRSGNQEYYRLRLVASSPAAAPVETVAAVPAPQAPTVPVYAPATLETLLTDLEMSFGEREFWTERKQILSGEVATPADQIALASGGRRGMRSVVELETDQF